MPLDVDLLVACKMAQLFAYEPYSHWKWRGRLDFRDRMARAIHCRSCPGPIRVDLDFLHGSILQEMPDHFLPGLTSHETPDLSSSVSAAIQCPHMPYSERVEWHYYVDFLTMIEGLRDLEGGALEAWSDRVRVVHR